MNRNIIAFLTVLFLLVLNLSACQKSDIKTSGSNRDKKIVIWCWDTYETAFNEAIKEYKKVNENVQFDVVPMAQDDVVQKFNIALSGKTDKNKLPNIIVVEDYNLFGYIKHFSGIFKDLTNEINPDNFMKFKLDTMMYNNKIYGVPSDSGVAVMFYRMDLLEKAGFKESDMDNITWSRFIEIGKSVKNATGVSMIPIIPESNMEGRIMLQSGKEWYVEGDGTTLNIDKNSSLLTMFKTMKTLFDSGVVYNATNWDDMVSSIYNDKVACVVGGCWWAPIIKEKKEQNGKWRIAKIPRMEGSDQFVNYSNIGGSSMCVISNDCQDVSADFLKNTFGSNPEVINNIIAKIPWITVLKSAVNVNNAKKPDSYFGNQPICQLMASWGENVPVVNYGYKTYEIDSIVGLKVKEYLNGKQLDAVINELSTEVEKIKD